MIEQQPLPEIIEQAPQDPCFAYAVCFPSGEYEKELGPKACAELRQATPQPWRDSWYLDDHFYTNHGALIYWLHIHFGINLHALSEKQIDETVQVNPISEVITVNGERYRIPHWCYLNTWGEYGDERARESQGIRRPCNKEEVQAW